MLMKRKSALIATLLGFGISFLSPIYFNITRLLITACIEISLMTFFLLWMRMDIPSVAVISACFYAIFNLISTRLYNAQVDELNYQAGNLSAIEYNQLSKQLTISLDIKYAKTLITWKSVIYGVLAFGSTALNDLNLERANRAVLLIICSPFIILALNYLGKSLLNLIYSFLISRPQRTIESSGEITD